MRRPQRRGFSLLEIVLSLAILAGAVAVLGEISRTSLQLAQSARERSHAQLLCESKLAEITAGLVAAESQPESPWQEADGSLSTEWRYAVEIGSTSDADLLTVRVTVRSADTSPRRRVECSLVQWMVDPALNPSTVDAEAASSSSTSTSGSSSGTSTSGGGT